MQGSQTESPLFDSLAQWLMEQSIRELPLDDLVRGMGRRLIAGGIPIHRIAIGGMILHPVFGALDIVWESPTDTSRHEKTPRGVMTTPEFQNAPFFHAMSNGIPFQRYHLERDGNADSFALFDKFRAQGVTDYLVAFHSYGREDKGTEGDLSRRMQGVVSSFSTRRIGGFDDREIGYLEALTRTLSLCVKASTARELSRTLMDTYLGSLSGGQILEGLVERGDGKRIDCVLWYCDLRGSTALADGMPLDDFLRMLNDYFECTAGAVLDHGGEVLGFVGDAVIAIFPYMDGTRPLADMARAAAATAREAVARVARRNDNAGPDQPAIRFGISLHIGRVMYGNIGTDRRMGFSVVGPAVNEVARLEGLCKTLDAQIVASSSFGEVYPEPLTSQGTHPVAGVKNGLAAYTFPDFPPANSPGGGGGE